MMLIPMLGGMAIVWYLNPDSPELLVLMPILFFAMIIYMRLRPSSQTLAMKANFQSFRLTIDDECIRRESDDLPTIEIARKDIASIEKQGTRVWIIKSKTSTDMIAIQQYIQDPEQLEALLQSICPITYSEKSINWQAYTPVMAVVMIALMFGAFAIKTPWIVIACGSLTTVLLLGGLWFLQRSKYLPATLKKNLWAILLPLTAIIVRVIMAIQGLQ